MRTNIQSYRGGGMRRVQNAQSAGTMPSLPPSDRFHRELLAVAKDIAAAAVAFESRWTFGALARLHPDLSERLGRQRALWQSAADIQDEERILAIGRGLVRGYNACVMAMESSIEDDAWRLGHCRHTGFKVAIGPPACAQRVHEIFGGDVSFYTPDEIAVILGEAQAVPPINAVKAAFSGAEVVEVRRVSDECASS